MPAERETGKNAPLSPSVRFERILVATDFSAGARAALDCALAIAKPFHSKVFLLHAIPATVFQYLSPESSQQVIAQARQFAEQEMRRLVEEAGCAGTVREEILTDGNVWPLVRDFVKTNSIDLVTLGAHGRTAAKKELLGPVAEEIFRLAACPILTVGSSAGRSGSFPDEIRRILYATNFKPHAERASVYAYAMERELGAKLSVLHVVEDQQDAPKAGHDIVREFIINRMRTGMPSTCVGKRETDYQVRFGQADEEILRVSREERSDLIVLGLRSGRGDVGLLPSAVAYKLACQAPCPVLTTRQ